MVLYMKKYLYIKKAYKLIEIRIVIFGIIIHINFIDYKIGR